MAADLPWFLHGNNPISSAIQNGLPAPTTRAARAGAGGCSTSAGLAAGATRGGAASHSGYAKDNPAPPVLLAEDPQNAEKSPTISGGAQFVKVPEAAARGAATPPHRRLHHLRLGALPP